MGIGPSEFIIQHLLAKEHLRVCWESPNGDNCERCLRCVRTMVVLEVIDKLENSRSFPWKQLDLATVRRLYLGREWSHFKNLIRYRRGKSREDVAAAIGTAVERTARINRWMLFGFFGLV